MWGPDMHLPNPHKYPRATQFRATAGLRVPMRENTYECVQMDTVLQGFCSRPRGSDRGHEEGGVPSLQAAEPACLFLPPHWAQGRHFWVDEDARLQPLSAKGRRGPRAF